MPKALAFFRRTIYLWVILFYIVMTIIMTMPLVVRMTDSIAGRVGDNIHFIWRIGWAAKALFELHTNPFDVWFLNYPEGWNMAYTEITAAQILMALPFHFIAGPTFAYNMGMLLTFVLSALGMHLWVYHLTRSHAAALVAGTAFAFLPYRMAHFLVGHYDLSGTQWLPIYFYGFFEILTSLKQAGDSSQPPDSEVPERLKSSLRTWRVSINWKPVLLAAVGLGMTGLSSQYYLYITLLISAFLVLVHHFSRKIPNQAGKSFNARALERLRSLPDVRLWFNLAAMGIIALPLLAAAVAPFINLNQQGGLPDRSLGVVRLYSASPTDFLLPSTDHFLVGRWVGDHFNRDLWNESTLYLGVVCVALTIFAWVKRKEHSPFQPLLRLLVWGSGFALLMAMGTDLHWNEQPVEITLPGFLQNVLNRSSSPILLPAYFFFRYFPFFAKLRALMRFGLFANLFICAAAGLGTAWLLERFRSKKVQSVVAIGVLALVLFDFYPGPYTEFAEISPRPVDAWLALQPGTGAVVQMPFFQSEDQEQTYYTLFHRKPFVGGFFNAFPPPQYQRIQPLLEAFPNRASLDLLKELGVQYIVVDINAYPDPELVRYQIETLDVTFSTQVEDQLVFEIDREYEFLRCPCDPP